MLKHKTTIILLLLILLCLNILNFFILVGYWYYLIPILIYFIFTAIGSFRISSNFYFPVICSVKTNEKQIAISFDDGPSPDITNKVLDILKTNEIKASFFVIGRKIVGNESILVRIDKEGHIIGNHTYSHSYFFDLFLPSKMANEFAITNNLIEKYTGKQTLYFRPPYGVTNPLIKIALKKFNFSVIGWSVRSHDGVKNDTNKIIKRVTRNLKSGDIILFHDNYPSIEKVLNEFITFTKNNGFKIVSLDTLLK
jgi:peptidoglycan/xylan/chitin deacetylase (PgdA/CDA1 family)